MNIWNFQRGADSRKVFAPRLNACPELLMGEHFLSEEKLLNTDEWTVWFAQYILKGIKSIHKFFPFRLLWVGARGKMP